MMRAMANPPPRGNLRTGRVIGALVVLAGIGFAIYWFGFH
jgi:hypothetical protein